MNSLISGITTKQAVFFKALPQKGLAEKKSQARGGRKSKTRLTIVFFVNAAGEKAIGPLVVRSKKPHCLRTLRVSPDPMAFITTQIRKHG